MGTRYGFMFVNLVPYAFPVGWIISEEWTGLSSHTIPDFIFGKVERTSISRGLNVEIRFPAGKLNRPDIPIFLNLVRTMEVVAGIKNIPNWVKMGGFLGMKHAVGFGMIGNVRTSYKGGDKSTDYTYLTFTIISKDWQDANTKKVGKGLEKYSIEIASSGGTGGAGKLRQSRLVLAVEIKNEILKYIEEYEIYPLFEKEEKMLNFKIEIEGKEAHIKKEYIGTKILHKGIFLYDGYIFRPEAKVEFTKDKRYLFFEANTIYYLGIKK